MNSTVTSKFIKIIKIGGAFIAQIWSKLRLVFANTSHQKIKLYR